MGGNPVCKPENAQIGAVADATRHDPGRGMMVNALYPCLRELIDQ
jgi:hypothetical protein